MNLWPPKGLVVGFDTSESVDISGGELVALAPSLPRATAPPRGRVLESRMQRDGSLTRKKAAAQGFPGQPAGRASVADPPGYGPVAAISLSSPLKSSPRDSPAPLHRDNACGAVLCHEPAVSVPELARFPLESQRLQSSTVHRS